MLCQHSHGLTWFAQRKIPVWKLTVQQHRKLQKLINPFMHMHWVSSVHRNEKGAILKRCIEFPQYIHSCYTPSPSQSLVPLGHVQPTICVVLAVCAALFTWPFDSRPADSACWLVFRYSTVCCSAQGDFVIRYFSPTSKRLGTGKRKPSQTKIAGIAIKYESKIKCKALI